MTMLVHMQAVRELFDNMIFVGETPNASEAHIYFRDTDLGKDPQTKASAGSKSFLTLRDNGRGMSEPTWVWRASRFCRPRGCHIGYEPKNAQTLSRFGGLPQLSMFLGI